MGHLLSIIAGLGFIFLGVFMVFVCHYGYVSKKELIREIGKSRYIDNAITYSLGTIVFFVMGVILLIQ